jgi:hypothetical protein
MTYKLDPLQGILTILEESNFTATSKLGLLLALIELAPETHNDMLSIDRVSEKILEIHWNHAEPYTGSSGKGVLRQLAGNDNTKIIKVILDLKDYLSQNNLPSVTFETTFSKLPVKERKTAVQKVSQATKRFPLTLLQKIGGEEIHFLYTVEGNYIKLKPDAIIILKMYGHILREMIQFKFTNFVLSNNSKLLGVEDKANLNLHEFLFGETRHMPPDSMRETLLDLQKGICIYTGEKIALASDSLDHLIPWSRLRVSAIENFVITTIKINSSKSNSLPGISLLRKWAEYEVSNRVRITKIASEFGWVTDISRVVSNLLNIYSVAPDFTSVANVRDGKFYTGTFASGEREEIDTLLNSLVGIK